MENLTVKAQTELIKEAMISCGKSFKHEDRMAAFKTASEKFNLKIKTRFKNTYHETIILLTNYNNCDEVQEFISSIGVSCPIVNGELLFYTKK